MGRKAVRTVMVNRDMVMQCLGLFGTIKNAHRQLGLSGRVSYAVFYQGMSFMPMRPEVAKEIEQSWTRWKDVFLVPGVPASHDLAITILDLEDYPFWHPKGGGIILPKLDGRGGSRHTKRKKAT